VIHLIAVWVKIPMGKMKGKNTSGINTAKNGDGHCCTITVYKYILSVFHWCWLFSE